MTTKQPSIALSIDEADPGTFYWVLTTPKDNGKPQQLKAADEPADSYEAALAAGTRALRALIHERESASA